MNKRYLIPTLLFLCAGSILWLSSCKKINEATELGDDLIPPVDNITTFDTTLAIQAFNNIFDLTNDSTRSTAADEQYVGFINNDPLFGRTDAKLFFQLKPPFYRYAFNQTEPDSLLLDSVVLVLHPTDVYGDTTVSQTFNVYEIDQSSVFKSDSAYLIRKPNQFAYNNLLGTRTFFPRGFKDTVRAFQDTTPYQLRIRLNDAFGQRLLNYDSVGVNGAYNSDTAFQKKLKGFAVESTNGNAVVGINLTGANTKLAVYYKWKRPQHTAFDTATVAYFSFTSVYGAGQANIVTRDYSGTSWASAANDEVEDNQIFIQNTPGTFAKIKIPGLIGLNNRVIHRAELIMEQVYNGPTDSLFYVPGSLFVDAYDPSISKYRTVPYDLLMTSTGGANYSSFGSYPTVAKDANGNTIRRWRFNLTRYVQHVVNGKLPVYELRLSSPSYVIETYGIPGLITDGTIAIQPLTPVSVTRGRVRLQGGQPLNNPQRMRLRIVYSKI